MHEALDTLEQERPRDDTRSRGCDAAEHAAAAPGARRCSGRRTWRLPHRSRSLSSRSAGLGSPRRIVQKTAIARPRLIHVRLEFLHLSLSGLKRLLQLNRALHEEIERIALARRSLSDQRLGFRVFWAG